MARFLDTRKCAAELSDLIKDTGSDLTLVSPYLQFSKDFKELLSYRNSKGARTTLIFREPKLNSDDLSQLGALRSITLRFHEDLHAKCYLNGAKMIITSMNLYQFSMDHNKEMGVLIAKSDASDRQLYEDAYKEVQYIYETSKPFPGSVQGEAVRQGAGAARNIWKKGTGYCIRTGIEIPFDVDKPFSAEAFRKWNEYGDPEYPEKYCHFSGELSNGETSFDKPILKKNWKKAQEIYGI